MLDSIYVGMTGLLSYSQGLRVIANNTANMNTPGFKGSVLQFSDLGYTQQHLGGPGAGTSTQLGFGVNTLGTRLSFAPGEMRQTDNDLDLAVDGQGMFVLREDDGTLSYTRAGQFQFNTDGVLVNQADKLPVMGYDAAGNLVMISLAGQMTHPGKPTARVSFTGNLSSTATEQTVGSVKVVDAAGGEHTLSVKFTNTASTEAGTWKVELMDGSTSVGSGVIAFVDGKPVADRSSVAITYKPAGLAEQALTLDFGTDVSSFASGNLSTLAMKTQDGVAPGALTGATFDASGRLVMRYANGQTRQGPALALARAESPDAVGAEGDNRFRMLDPAAWRSGTAGANGFGSVRSRTVEVSNVDLSREFSDLVVMQRGYQASSQVISTANEMLQELFQMKSK
ncbi:flagellar hook protein FlgE [Xenophilus sp.]|uniref:flagellar hook protein FlgE n=1 Tax=Xenophilus sp. TaxID=1873499 RepID=UPI0037DD0840